MLSQGNYTATLSVSSHSLFSSSLLFEISNQKRKRDSYYYGSSMVVYFICRFKEYMFNMFFFLDFVRVKGRSFTTLKI